jgi:hypothetical protein
MANYRIKVEVLNDNMERLEQLECGMDVEGFVILANVNNESAMSCIMNMSRKDIADAIHGDRPIVEAALLSQMLSHLEEKDDE